MDVRIESFIIHDYNKRALSKAQEFCEEHKRKGAYLTYIHESEKEKYVSAGAMYRSSEDEN